MPTMPASHEPELLTINEAAELLRAPVATLRYWRHLGTGPRSFRLGRRVLYRSADLRSWIEAQADQMNRAEGDLLSTNGSREGLPPSKSVENSTLTVLGPRGPQLTEETRGGVDRKEA